MEYTSQFFRDEIVSRIVSKIRTDRDRAKDGQIKKFLDYLAENVFDPELTIGRVYEALELNYRSFVRRFAAVYAMPPRTYLQGLRMEAGAQLLIDSPFSIDTVGELVGFGSGQSFSEAFNNAFGERPSAYRRKWKSSNSQDEEDRSLLQKFRGKLNLTQARKVISLIQTEHPDILGRAPDLRYHLGEESYSATSFRVSDQTVERLAAERLWAKIRTLSSEDQKVYIRDKAHFEGPALFEVLREKTIEEGRKSRSKGVEIAQLALFAATRAEDLDQDCRSNLWSIAWAWVGNAYRLIFNLKQSARCFRHAELLLPVDPDLLTKAEILHLRAALCLSQKRLEEGIELERDAITIFERLGNSKALAKALHSMGNLYRGVSSPEVAAEFFSRALILHSDHSETEQVRGAAYNLAVCCWETGDHLRAKEIVTNLRHHVKGKPDSLFGLLLLWLEGRIVLDQNEPAMARALLEKAYTGFTTMDSYLASFTVLDLAISQTMTGQTDNISDLLKPALGVLGAWRDEEFFSTSYKKLERAVATGLIAVDDLVEARDLTVRLTFDPTDRSLLVNNHT